MTEIWQDPPTKTHVVAIIGGAVAGSEAAATLADQGILSVVIEQNAKPFGKIEDGLPRWHDKLRKAEYERISSNLKRPEVAFVPQTKLGVDITIDELQKEWGVNAVFLASGAWQDRPLQAQGVEQLLGKGLVYQNPFVYWFNHYLEDGYQGPTYQVSDNAVVIGGGLASIDVVKIINIELYTKALLDRGVKANVETLQHDLEIKGIEPVVRAHGFSLEDLGIHGCTLFYRRRKQDMPLASAPANATDEQLAKVATARERIMDKVMDKYLVRFEGCRVPVALLQSEGQLTGVRFSKTEIRDGKVMLIDEPPIEVPTTFVVSSIGSVPQSVAGVDFRGELPSWKNWETGELDGRVGVYGLGNVLTGKGNIKASRQNAKQIASHVIESYLGVGDAPPTQAPVHSEIRKKADVLAAAAKITPPKSAADIRRIADRVEQRWKEIDYIDFDAWMTKHC